MLISSEAVQQFRKDGVTILRGVFTDWVDVLSEGIAANLRSPGPDVKIYTGNSGGRFIGDYCNWQRIEEFRSFIFDSAVGSMARDLMGTSSVRLFHEHVLVKEPGADVSTPWHHDMPYYCIDAVNTVSFWIPIDDVPRERTLEFVAGSHRWGSLYRPDRFNGDALNPGDGLPRIPDIGADRSAYTILGWQLQAGDAVAFDFRTVHGAAANHSTHQQRRAFSLRLVGDGACFRRSEGVSSPPFRDVTLAQGAALDVPEFPLIAGRLPT